MEDVETLNEQDSNINACIRNMWICTSAHQKGACIVSFLFCFVFVSFLFHVSDGFFFILKITTWIKVLKFYT